MRKQIAAANWKMNLTILEAETLLSDIIKGVPTLNENQYAVFAVPAPYLQFTQNKVAGINHLCTAAQNISDKKSGAYTGETSVGMLQSLQVDHAIIGHSERREYFNESNQILADKVRICLDHSITPIFCCGEALPIREQETQNDFVAKQLEESLFKLPAEDVLKVVIAYEPIWAIGTGKTASSAQAQEMHAFIRSHLASKYGQEVADQISILYGGSVKGNNAAELFNQPDVDGGLVGGASLIAGEFLQIIKALK